METTALANTSLITSSPPKRRGRPPNPVPPFCTDGPPKKRGRPHGPIKPMPMTRADLDSRTSAAKHWDHMEAGITSDLGGELSMIQKTLVSAFCAVGIQLIDLNTQALLGKPIQLSDLSLAASTLVRIATKLGLSRQARNVGSTLGDILRQDYEKQRQMKEAKG